MCRNVPTHSITLRPQVMKIHAGTEAPRSMPHEREHQECSGGWLTGGGVDLGTQEQVSHDSPNFPWGISPSPCCSPPHDWYKQ